MANYIFVSGGVISGIGKGVTSAAIGVLLKKQGYTVTAVKCENYLNVDSGTINPIEHGDPFLTQDGTESDMDLGTYERFLNQEMAIENFITFGQIYKSIIEKERAFGYKGKTVDPTEEVCEEVIRRIYKAQKKTNADFVLVELGGTAGEYQNVFYYEASRRMKYQKKEKVIHVHVAYAPFPAHLGEPKAKPIQLSVKTLNTMGIQPDFVVVRSEVHFDERRREKLSLYCNLDSGDVIENPNLNSIYELPGVLDKQQFSQKIITKLNNRYRTRLKSKSKLDLKDWEELGRNIESVKVEKPNGEPVLAIVGKYFATGEYFLADSYAALLESINHASWRLGKKISLKYINSESDEKNMDKALNGVSGIIVPIGWGSRGAEGKIKAIEYARKNNIPYLGLCYGMQLAAVEWGRDVLNLKDANTEENDPKTKNPIIHLIPEKENYVRIKSKGVTMRLGGYDCVIKPGTLAFDIYSKYPEYILKKNTDKTILVNERHRHRFEFNNEYREQFEKSGFVFSGTSPDNFFVEMIELPKKVHPFFFATQAHPEYKSTPLNPHPVFLEFIKTLKK
ncbi:MAG: CTP synthase [bacterium]